MKKWMGVLAIAFICAAPYLFIPAKVQLHQATEVNALAKAFARAFPDEAQWKKWWPDTASARADNPSTFELDENAFKLKEKRYSSLIIEVNGKELHTPSELLFVPKNENTVQISWDAQAVTSLNPVLRVKRFFEAKNLQKDMGEILRRIKTFYEQERNLYGFDIRAEFVKDSSLIATTILTTGPASTSEIYALVDKLQAFATKNGAKQTDAPMLNTFTNDSLNFKTQVALPIDKRVADEGSVGYRWMLKGGNILTTEVKGGPHTISTAFAAMDVYISEHRRTAPAIPFQSLTTDRRQESDTSKWVTKLYWPVM